MLTEAWANASAWSDEAKNVSLCVPVLGGHSLAWSTPVNALNFCPNTSLNAILRQCERPKVPWVSARGRSSEAPAINTVSKWKLRRESHRERPCRRAIRVSHAKNGSYVRFMDDFSLIVDPWSDYFTSLDQLIQNHFKGVAKVVLLL